MKQNRENWILFQQNCTAIVYNPLQEWKFHYWYFSGSAQEEKDVLKLWKFQKKNLYNAPGSSLEYTPSRKTNWEKNISCDCSEILGNLPKKVL